MPRPLARPASSRRSARAPIWSRRSGPAKALTLKRRKDFWAEDHPLTRGLFNPDEIRYDFYRDANALFEAFKAGLYDVRIEPDPTRWMTGYDVPAVRDGRIQREALHFQAPKGMTGLVFNTAGRSSPMSGARGARHPVRFRMGQPQPVPWRLRGAGSFFSDSEFRHWASPPMSVRNLAGEFPRAACATTFWREAGCRPRATARAATASRRAGPSHCSTRPDTAWSTASCAVLKGGDPLAFEITVTNRPQERLALNYASSLERLGIGVSVRLIDDVQYWRRLSAFDFDMIQWTWPASASPGNEQIGRWGSANADRKGALNYAGVKSPAIDAVLQAILGARKREDFVAAVRALDRAAALGLLRRAAVLPARDLVCAFTRRRPARAQAGLFPRHRSSGAPSGAPAPAN
jgi:peptide/nickel transport system substrate-binding protein